MAKIMFQTWLDRVADFVFADDFESWADAMALPLLVISATDTSRIATKVLLRAKYDLWRNLFAVQRVTHMIRIAHAAAHVTDTRIAGVYSTELLSNGQRVMLPFESTMTLDWQDDRWRASALRSGMATAHRHLIHSS